MRSDGSVDRVLTEKLYSTLPPGFSMNQIPRIKIGLIFYALGESWSFTSCDLVQPSVYDQEHGGANHWSCCWSSAKAASVSQGKQQGGGA